MGTIIKFIIAIVIVWLGYAFILNNEALLKDQYEDAKQDLVEYVNPVAKEERLLGDVSDNLTALNAYINQLSQEDIANAQAAYANIVAEANAQVDENGDPIPHSLPATLPAAEQLLANTVEAVEEIDEVNDKKASTISAQVSQIEELIKKFPGTNSDVASFTYTDEEGQAYSCFVE